MLREHAGRSVLAHRRARSAPNTPTDEGIAMIPGGRGHWGSRSPHDDDCVPWPRARRTGRHTGGAVFKAHRALARADAALRVVLRDLDLEEQRLA